jgi:D-alanyl-D-alanine dipeptidase
MTTTAKNSTRDVKEIAKCVRADLKAAVACGALSALTFGVKISRYSMGQSLTVTVTSVPVGYVILNAKREAWTTANPHKGFHEAPLDCMPRHSEGASLDLKIIERIVGAYNWDRSDHMSDYYSVNFHQTVAFDGELARAERAALVATLRAAEEMAAAKAPLLRLVAANDREGHL